MNSKIGTLLILLVALFVLVFFTRPLFYSLSQNLDIASTSVVTHDEKKAELKNLQNIQAEIASGTGAMISTIKMYAQDFTEDKVINYIFSYIQDTGGLALVREINMEAGDVNEFGFNEGRVQVELRVNDENALLDFIEAMTNPVVTPGQEAEVYKFFIDNFTYPSGIAGSFNVSVPMKVFYK